MSAVQDVPPKWLKYIVHLPGLFWKTVQIHEIMIKFAHVSVLGHQSQLLNWLTGGLFFKELRYLQSASPQHWGWGSWSVCSGSDFQMVLTIQKSQLWVIYPQFKLSHIKATYMPETSNGISSARPLMASTWHNYIESWWYCAAQLLR